MKKVLLTLLAGLPALAFAQTNYTINGKVGKINAPSKIFLRYVVDGKLVVDSTVAQNGAFTFKGTVADVTSANLIADYAGNGMAKMDRKQRADVAQLYLVNGVTTVTGADSLYKAKIGGTKINEENTAYKALLKPASDKMAKLNAEYSAASPETRKNKEFMEGLEKRSDEIQAEQTEINKQYVKTHPNSYLSIVALSSAGGYNPEYNDVAPMYNGLSAEVKNTKAGKDYASRLDKWKQVAMGATAPEFAQADTAGKIVSLASFRGKYILVDFWASWCGPCRAENPNVVKAYNKYKNKNFTILGVSLDQPGAKDKWLEAIHKDGLAWNHVSDLQYWKNAAAQAYGVQAIPQNFLLDPSGKIIGKNLRGEDLDKKLGEIFGKI